MDILKTEDIMDIRKNISRNKYLLFYLYVALLLMASCKSIEQKQIVSRDPCEVVHVEGDPAEYCLESLDQLDNM